MSRVGRFWRTVRHLKWQQVIGRVKFRLALPILDDAAVPALRSFDGKWVAPARRRASLTGPTSFQLLSEAGSLDQHGWDGPQRSKLWRYNQHYFDDLNALDAIDRREWHVALIHRWISDNPPTGGSGWEPYPTSLRIVNWIKFALSGHELSDAARYSLAIQTRWLSKRLEWHLLGNHLFANAKALVFAGLFFDGEEADGWLAIGVEILREQMPEQILPDGAHFELSPMYHALAVEDLLDLTNFARVYSEEVLSRELASRIPRMLDWLLFMTHPDGKIAFFNDAAFGIAPDIGELRDYAERLGFAAKPPAVSLIHNQPSGYIRMERGGAVLIADIAPIGPDYLPGHAHADTLSFELSLLGRRLVVNGGTSIYGKDEERLRQRGTAAHSTLVVDGENSSEVWSGFRVGRRAKPFDVATLKVMGSLIAHGAHNGYTHLPGRPVHRREWCLNEGSLIVRDIVRGSGNHRLEVYFHLAPGIKVATNTENGMVELYDIGGGHRVSFLTEGGMTQVVPSKWNAEFGLSIETTAIKVSARRSLPHTLKCELAWSAQ